jgi:ParB family chromosome partitioning protein
LRKRARFREQRALREAGADKIEGSKVCERLSNATSAPRVKASLKSKPALKSSSGHEVGIILADTRTKGITININPKGQCPLKILDSLRTAIENAKFAR